MTPDPIKESREKIIRDYYYKKPDTNIKQWLRTALTQHEEIVAKYTAQIAAKMCAEKMAQHEKVVREEAKLKIKGAIQNRYPEMSQDWNQGFSQGLEAALGRIEYGDLPAQTSPTL